MQCPSEPTAEIAELISRSYELEQRVQQLQQVLNRMKLEVQETIDARQRELDRYSRHEMLNI